MLKINMLTTKKDTKTEHQCQKALYFMNGIPLCNNWTWCIYKFISRTWMMKLYYARMMTWPWSEKVLALSQAPVLRDALWCSMNCSKHAMCTKSFILRHHPLAITMLQQIAKMWSNLHCVLDPSYCFTSNFSVDDSVKMKRGRLAAWQATGDINILALH